MRALQKSLRLRLKMQGLTSRAFIHQSYINDKRITTLVSNKRLEYLGDAVLELAVTEYLYCKYPDEREGMLTKLRACS